MSKELLAEKSIFLEDPTGKTSITLWISCPYQDSEENWTCDWGARGILDQARSLVGNTPFDALVRNLADMRLLLKENLRGRKIMDMDSESGYVSLKALFGDL